MGKRHGWLLTLALMSGVASAQGAKTTGPTDTNRESKGGFVSDKTKAKFSEANIEDITNENFPDLIESFDYPNADVTDVIKAISELTGKNFIVDPQVHGKVTIIAPSQITVAEAYKAFLSALAINGMAIVPGDGFLKIKPARQAQRDAIETYSGAYYPTSDQMITRIVKLKYISADEVNKNLRVLLQSKDGETNAYAPTNSLIISDYGSNIDRIMKILAQLDVPGFEEQLEVIRIRYAKAKEMADLLDQIITKGEGRQAGGAFGGVPRFRRATPETGGTTSGAENYSLVLPDERTNSIIVVGNQAGIEKIRKLVARLDFRLRPEDQGGVNVYYVRHSEADKIADIINGLATESKKAQDQGGVPKVGGPSSVPGASANAIFGGDVKATADKITNSLIITGSRMDYEAVKNLLGKIDIPRDQVFVKTVIMELGADDKVNWGLSYYRFDKNSGGIGRIGFQGTQNLANALNPINDSGAVLGFGGGGTFELKPLGGTGTSITVTSLIGLLNFYKTTTNANILSEPTLMALDNEEAEIEVGDKVPVAPTQQVTGSTATTSIQREPVTIKLTLTPYISPDSDSVQMKIKQEINQLSNVKIEASELAKNSIATSTRNIKTQIVVNSGDTAVLGGLMQDKDSEAVTKVPILGDIPILGWLFKSKLTEKTKRNLLVFITPKIVRNSDDNAAVLNQRLNERIEFIQRHMNGRDPYGEAIDTLPRRALKEQSTEEFNTEEPATESF